MSAARTHIYLLSFHGTWLGLDTSAQALLHVKKEDVAPPVQLLALAAEGALLGAALGGLVFAPGLYPGTLSLRAGAFYASAERDGRLPPAAPQCLGWESFLPVPEDQFLLLHGLADGGWEGVDAVSWLPRFQLRIGAHIADLRRSLPLPTASRTLTFTAPDGGVFTIQKAANAQPEIWIEPQGNMGNRALQYLAAHGLAMRAGGVVRKMLLPEWGIDAPAPPPDPARAAGTGVNRYQFDSAGLADCLRRGAIDAVRIESFTFHLDHYPPRAVCKTLFGPAKGGEDATGFGPDILVCSIRGGEILTGIHPDYLLLPPAYYQSLADRTGLKLVFHGQLGDDAYTQSLRDAFPSAEFCPSRGPGHDFETLRRSANIVLAISTFSWLAAWLSEAQRVFVPIAGMFNPVQHPDQLYLALDEPGYEYDLFPYAQAVDLFTAPEHFARLQALLASAMRPVTREEVAQIIARSARLGKGRVLTGGFDPAFYTRTYGDAAAYSGAALEHYMTIGWPDRRLPLAFDAYFYIAAYPDAAMAVAEGHFATPLEHFLAVGYGLGYKPKAYT
jgi:hypothetical protein